MANRDVPGTNSRSGSASGKRKSDKDKSDKDKSDKSRASRSKYADWGAKSPERQPPPEDPPQRTPAGPKPGAFTNAQPPTGGQSGPPQDPPAGSTDPAPPLPTDPPAPQPPLPTGIPPPGNPTPSRNMDFSDVVAGLQNLGSVFANSLKGLNDNMSTLSSNITEGFDTTRQLLEESEGESEGNSEGDSEIEEMDEGGEEGVVDGSEEPLLFPEEGASPATETPSPQTGVIDPYASSIYAKKASERQPPKERGDPIKDPHLVDYIQGLFTIPLTEEEFEEIKKEVLVPANLPCLVPPRIPEAAWEKLDGSAKFNDGLYAGAQAGLSVIGTKLTEALETLGQLAGQYPAVLKAQESVDSAMQLLACFFTRRGTEKRRKNVQMKFPTHLKKLVSAKFPSNSESLLGDMEENVKKLTELSKMSAQLAKTSGNGGAGPKKKFHKTGPKGGVKKKKVWQKRKKSGKPWAGKTDQRRSTPAKPNEGDAKKPKSAKDFRKKGAQQD